MPSGRMLGTVSVHLLVEQGIGYRGVEQRAEKDFTSLNSLF